MLRQYFVALVAILLVCGVADAQKRKKVNPVAKKPAAAAAKKIIYLEDKDEYAVYEAVLREKFRDVPSRTVVLNKEVTGCSTVIDREVEKHISRSVLEELFTDCSAKKWGNFELVGKHFQAGENIVLVSDDELAKILVPTCASGWKKFYRKYPNAAGNASLSRVGFDSGRNFAVVNFGNQSGCLSSGGQLVFLQKESDVWTVKKSQVTWGY